jgi:DNA-binding Lrp family transcriptional regulator
MREHKIKKWNKHITYRGCRASYRDIYSIVGITPNAIKERINMMVCNGIIQSFIGNINPALFEYEKECFL